MAVNASVAFSQAVDLGILETGAFIEQEFEVSNVSERSLRSVLIDIQPRSDASARQMDLSTASSQFPFWVSFRPKLLLEDSEGGEGLAPPGEQAWIVRVRWSPLLAGEHKADV